MELNRLAKGLSYLIITGTVKHLHEKTIEAMAPYIDSGKVDFEGATIAKRSRLWKAHEFLLEKGFTYHKHHAPRKIVYKNDKGIYASTGSKGKVFINYKFVKQFKNGKTSD